MNVSPEHRAWVDPVILPILRKEILRAQSSEEKMLAQNPSGLIEASTFFLPQAGQRICSIDAGQLPAEDRTKT